MLVSHLRSGFGRHPDDVDGLPLDDIPRRHSDADSSHWMDRLVPTANSPAAPPMRSEYIDELVLELKKGNQAAATRLIAMAQKSASQKQGTLAAQILTAVTPLRSASPLAQTVWGSIYNLAFKTTGQLIAGDPSRQAAVEKLTSTFFQLGYRDGAFTIAKQLEQAPDAQGRALKNRETPVGRAVNGAFSNLVAAFKAEIAPYQLSILTSPQAEDRFVQLGLNVFYSTAATPWAPTEADYQAMSDICNQDSSANNDWGNALVSLTQLAFCPGDVQPETMSNESDESPQLISLNSNPR